MLNYLSAIICLILVHLLISAFIFPFISFTGVSFQFSHIFQPSHTCLNEWLFHFTCSCYEHPAEKNLVISYIYLAFHGFNFEILFCIQFLCICVIILKGLGHAILGNFSTDQIGKIFLFPTRLERSKETLLAEHRAGGIFKNSAKRRSN